MRVKVTKLISAIEGWRNLAVNRENLRRDSIFVPCSNAPWVVVISTWANEGEVDSQRIKDCAYLRSRCRVGHTGCHNGELSY